MKNKQCFKEFEGKKDLIVTSWLAITDADVEGQFVDFYTRDPVDHLPWRQDFPLKDAYNYQCLVVSVEAEQEATRYGTLKKAEIYDANCGILVCALCSLPTPTAKMRVRGLCKVGSMFDKEYHYVILESGSQAYLGRDSSLIVFQPESNYWLWTDAKDPSSKGKLNINVDFFILLSFQLQANLQKYPCYSEPMK